MDGVYSIHIYQKTFRRQRALHAQYLLHVCFVNAVWLVLISSQVSYLFQLMRKVENRGFIFRLDFNGFISEVSDSFSPAAGADVSRSGVM